MIKVFTTFSLFILILACQPRNQNSSSFRDLEVMDAFTTQSQMEKALSKWKVNCVDSKNCPDSVGQLLVTDGYLLGACTATLIGPDVAITNSHCFDMRNNSNNAAIDPQLICESGTRIVFASQSQSGAEQLRCKKILVKSKIDGDSSYLRPDYAIIQLEKTTNRKFDRVTRKGIDNQMSLFMRKVNPIRNGLGELVVQECQSQYSTLLAPLAKDAHYFVHVVSGCETRSGNSGSSLVDNNGEIRGVLYQGIGAQSRQPRTALERDVRGRAIEDKISIIANASCMNYRFSGEEKRDEKRCIQYSMTRFQLTDALNPEDVQDQFSTDVREKIKNIPLSDTFGYQVKFMNKVRGFVFAPNCIKMFENIDYNIDYSISVSAPVWFWTPVVKVGSHLKAEVKTMTNTQKSCHVSFKYQDFLKQKKGLVQLSGAACVDSQGQVKEGYDIWEVCKP